MKIERKKMSEMNPAEYNPRDIRPEALEGLSGSIDRFGVMVPIIWNKRSGRIVGGHQRFKVLSAQGVEETDVVVVDMDNNEEIALNITMNNPESRGQFTKEVVTLLEEAKAKMADSFEEVGLGDMLNYLSRYKFEDAKAKKEREAREEDEANKGAPRVAKEGLMCPRCRSVWKKETGEVLKKGGSLNG
jgi:ParB-like chromosome segregation protein Spo0J